MARRKKGSDLFSTVDSCVPGVINQSRRPFPVVQVARLRYVGGFTAVWGQLGLRSNVSCVFAMFLIRKFNFFFFFSKSGINDGSVRLLGFSSPRSSLEQPWNTSGPGHVVFSSWRGKHLDSKWRRQRGSMQRGRAVTSSPSR